MEIGDNAFVWLALYLIVYCISVFVVFWLLEGLCRFTDIIKTKLNRRKK